MQRCHFANKVIWPYSQSYCFSSSHVWMWELDYKEGWVLKTWFFPTVVLEQAPESPLDKQGNQTSQSLRKSILNIHWKDWCWSWSSNTLAKTRLQLHNWTRTATRATASGNIPVMPTAWSYSVLYVHPSPSPLQSALCRSTAVTLTFVTALVSCFSHL